MRTTELAQGLGAQQHLVDRHFEATADQWTAIYRQATVFGVIHQERRATALNWIDDLGLPQGESVLEIGCGAGSTSVALAERGYDVTASDAVPAMIRLTEQRARGRDVAGRINTRLADAHALPFTSDSYSLVVALGVLPWLYSPELAVAEMARVLRPGGFLLVNVDNVFRLHYWLDVRLNPALAPVRDFVRASMSRIGVIREPNGRIPIRLESPRRFDARLARAGFEKIRGTTLGFGPFTFWNRPIFPDEVGIQLHLKLKNLADSNVPLIRTVGAQYLVLAHKASRDAEPSSGRAQAHGMSSEVA